MYVHYKKSLQYPIAHHNILYRTFHIYTSKIRSKYTPVSTFRFVQNAKSNKITSVTLFSANG